MNYTLEYLRRLFEEFFSSHSQVNHFHYGVIEEYIASKEDKDYISVNIEFTGTQFDEVFSNHTYTITISDLFNQNYPEMEHSVVSNTAQIMRDFLSFLRDMDFTFTSGNIQPFREESNDFTAGVVMVLGIQVPNQLNECSIPGYAQFLNSSSYAPVDRSRPNISINADYAISSSYALTASYALNGGCGSSNIDTGSLVTTSSFNSFTSSYNTGSFRGQFSGSFTGSFFGNVSSGANKWNLYMEGTADNYIAGKTGIGYNNPGIFYANKFVVQADGGVDDGITIYNPSPTGTNMLAFADGTTSNSRYAGFLAYNHSSNFMNFGTNGSAKMWLTTNGNLGIGLSTPDSYYANKLVVSSPDESGITIAGTTTSATNYLAFADGITGNEAYRGYVSYRHATDEMRIGTAGNQRVSIFSDGNVGINTNGVNSIYKLDVLGNVRFKAPAAVGEYAIFSNLGDTGSLRLVANGEIYIGGANQCTTMYSSDANNLNNIGILLHSNSPDLSLTISNRRAASVPLQNGALFVTRNGIETSGTSGNTNLFIVGHKGGESFSPTAGAVTHTSIFIRPVINQTGTAVGFTRGVYVAPILSSSANWRSIQWDNNDGWGVFGQGGAANFLSGSTTFGRGIIATYTPTGSTDPTLPTGSICADDNFLYRRNSSGAWMKIGWQAF